MLVPHRREDAEFGEARGAPDQLEDTLIFVGLEAVLSDELGRDGGFVAQDFIHAARPRCSTRPANSPRPSVQPMMSSTWFSGCGIMPSTLPPSLMRPAMECDAPLKFHCSPTSPSGEA